MPAPGPWTEDELDRVGSAQELDLSSAGPDGTLGPATTMWVVRVGDDLYVRSAGGPDRPWYRRALAAGAGRIGAGGVARSVTFASVAPDVEPDIDAAYHAKYDSYGPRIVGSVTGEHAHLVTIRLAPTADLA